MIYLLQVCPGLVIFIRIRFRYIIIYFMILLLQQSGKPVIYLPMHRSHLDYVLITYILWHYGIRAPYVAAGDNLNIFGFG